jgi:hypothetical protein
MLLVREHSECWRDCLLRIMRVLAHGVVISVRVVQNESLFATPACLELELRRFAGFDCHRGMHDRTQVHAVQLRTPLVAVSVLQKEGVAATPLGTHCSETHTIMGRDCRLTMVTVIDS